MIRQSAWIAAVVCTLMASPVAWSQSSVRLQSGAAVTRGDKKLAAPRPGLALKFGDLIVGPASIGWDGSSRIRALKGARAELVRHAPEAEWALRLRSGTLIADTASGRQGFALLLLGHAVAGAPSSTALCPFCGIDAVLGSASGIALEPAALQRLHEHWFGPRLEQA